MLKTDIEKKLTSIFGQIHILLEHTAYDAELDETVNAVQENLIQTSFTLTEAQISMIADHSTLTLREYMADAGPVRALKHALGDIIATEENWLSAYKKDYMDEAKLGEMVAHLSTALNDIAHNYEIIVPEGYIPETLLPAYKDKILPQLEEVKTLLEQNGIKVAPVSTIGDNDGYEHINRRLERDRFLSLG